MVMLILMVMVVVVMMMIRRGENQKARGNVLLCILLQYWINCVRKIEKTRLNSSGPQVIRTFTTCNDIYPWFGKDHPTFGIQ